MADLWMRCKLAVAGCRKVSLRAARCLENVLPMQSRLQKCSIPRPVGLIWPSPCLPSTPPQLYVVEVALPTLELKSPCTRRKSGGGLGGLLQLAEGFEEGLAGCGVR